MSTVLIHADASTFDTSHEPTTRSSMLPLSATSRLMRKSSVHDVHESTRDEFNETFAEIDRRLSRLKSLLEMMSSLPVIRDEFLQLKRDLLVKINDLTDRLKSEAESKSSTVDPKRTSVSWLSNSPQRLVFSIECLRSELIKARYLFRSFSSDLSASSTLVSSSILTSLVIKSMTHRYLQHSTGNARHVGPGGAADEDQEQDEDLIELNRDVAALDEQSHMLTQRFYSQIPDWHTPQNGSTREPPAASSMTQKRDMNGQRFRALSSTMSIEHSHFSARLSQKCHMFCCICTPKYL